MSVDYISLATVGFKVTADEVKNAIEYKDSHGEEGDGDIWFENLVDNDILVQLDCYGDPEFYIYAMPEKTVTVGEGCAISILDIMSNLNYRECQGFIDQFREDFGPVINMFTHQLDVFMGLKVC